MLPPLLAMASACAGAAQPAGAGPAPSASTACRPAELRALFRGFQASGGPLAGAVVFVDAGPDACQLAGRPRSVGLLDDGGAPVAVKERPLDQPAAAGAVDLAPGVPLPAFGAPVAQGSAWVVVTWSNWCSTESPSVRSLVIGLGGGGSLEAPLDPGLPGWANGPPAPRCVDVATDSVIAFGRFRA